mmetsp:Transcript_15708/g.43391  ORF Transcript_15708/g.43391 Transcript_15708/m.43391 type:complete len:497 (-) Transcript_15708:1090-2580(-)
MAPQREQPHGDKDASNDNDDYDNNDGENHRRHHENTVREILHDPLLLTTRDLSGESNGVANVDVNANTTNEAFRTHAATTTSTTNGDGDSDATSTDQLPTYIHMSLIVFLIGGIIYLVLAVWDLASPLDEDDAAATNATISGSHRAIPPIDDWDWYTILTVVAPLMYVLNFVLDIYEIQTNPDGTVNTPYPTGQNIMIPIGLFGVASATDLLGSILYLCYGTDEDKDGDGGSGGLDAAIANATAGLDAAIANATAASEWMQNHTLLEADGVTEDASSTSGFIAFAKYLVDHDILSTVAVHFYLIQAIAALWPGDGKERDAGYSPANNSEPDEHSGTAAAVAASPESFVDEPQNDDNDDATSAASSGGDRDNSLYRAGDALFFIGCIIDVIISYLDVDGMETKHQRMMQVWALVSAVLWFLDAVCYILAGIMEYDKAVAELLLDDFVSNDDAEAADEKHVAASATTSTATATALEGRDPLVAYGQEEHEEEETRIVV